MNSKVKWLVLASALGIGLFAAFVSDGDVGGLALNGLGPGADSADDVGQGRGEMAAPDLSEPAPDASDDDLSLTETESIAKDERLSVVPLEMTPIEEMPADQAPLEPIGAINKGLLVPSFAKSGQHFGGDLDVCEGRLIVAGAGSHGALAYIFEGSPRHLKLTAELGDHFNPGTYSTVAIGESHALVGRKSWSENYSLGTVFVFELHPQGWLHTGDLEPGGEEKHWSFGYDLAIDGKMALVGDPFAVATGAAYVFEDWEQGWNVVRLTSATPAEGSHFGISVALSNSTCLIGAPEEQKFSGAAYIFGRNEQGQWEQVARLTAPTPVARRSFGAQVALDGEVAVVAEPGHRRGTIEEVGPGAVYVFEREEDEWTLMATLQGDEPRVLDSFGKSLALKEGALLVTGLISAGGQRLGSAEEFSIGLFERKLEGWGPIKTLQHSSESYSHFSSSLPIAWIGNMAALGLPNSTSESVRSGSVSLIDLD